MKKVLLALAAGCAAAAAATTPELVTVGDPGNPGKSIPYIGNLDWPRGSVDYTYRIGKTSVTNAEYADFLNRCAKAADQYKLWDERMAITRSGSTFTALPATASRPVVWVSRTAAARYCNFLTTGDTEKGAYRLGVRKQLQRNASWEVVITPRDLTGQDSGTVYFLPDMHEFFKAGWYGGDGQYRILTAKTASQPSHYGMIVPGGKPGDWVENKYYGAVPIAFGGASLNTESYQTGRDDTGSGEIGFRVAATAPVTFGKQLNSRRNFFFSPEDRATLRIRSDAPREIAFRLEMRNHVGDLLWEKQEKKQLRTGVAELPVELPQQDGYYELLASYDGVVTRIPIGVFRDPVYSGPDGNFGMVCHPTRHEQRFSFDDYDLELLTRNGCGIARVDFLDADRQLLERMQKAGLRVVMCFRSLDTMDNLAKWLKDEVAPVVAAHKDLIHDWEIGNEPTYWKCSSEDYAQILKEAGRVVREIDPQANVICGDMMAIHAGVLKNRGGDFCDAVAQHIYGFYTPEFWGFAGKMRELNGWKRAAGIGAKPVWMTEIGTTNYEACYLVPVKTAEESRRYQMLSVPKQLAAALAFGASKVMPYNFRALPLDTHQEDFGLIDRDAYPKPAIAAYRATSKLLGRAKFAGFLKGHSFQLGKPVGLVFKDEAGRDVIVFWRNDLFSQSNFSQPLSSTIHPPQPVKIKAEDGTVELFNTVGGRSELPVKGGVATIPVGEYPVFVRGKLLPEFQEVSTAHDVPAIRFPDVRVRIVPVEDTRASIQMKGVVSLLTAGAPAEIRVRLYNLTPGEIGGVCRLEPRNDWREFPWKVAPAEQKITLGANGWAEARFTVDLPPRNLKDGEHYFYFDAVFIAAPGTEFRDTMTARAAGRLWETPDAWKLYKSGYTLKRDAERFVIERAENAEVNCHLSNGARPVLAKDAADFPAELQLAFHAAGAGVKAVSCTLRDNTGEIFQIRTPLTGKVESVTFDLSRFPANKNISAWNTGNRDKIIDYPATFDGFVFEFDGNEAGTVTLEPPRISRFGKVAWRTPAAWKVYKNGYRLTASPEKIEIRRDGDAESNVVLATPDRRPLAGSAERLPGEIRLAFQPDGPEIKAVSLLLRDVSGETWQLRMPLPNPATRQVRFDLNRYRENKNLVAWNTGDRNKQIDYPVNLEGFVFEFASGSPGTLTVFPPEIGAIPSVTASTGGGAENMNE